MPGDGRPQPPQARSHREHRRRALAAADRPRDLGMVTRPWLLVDQGGVLDPEDFDSEDAARDRLSHPLWARRPWQIYRPDGRPANYKKDQP